MYYINKRFILILLLFTSSILFSESLTVTRDSFFFTTDTVSTTSEPSTLKYYDFKDNLADEIVIDVFKGKDLTNLKGKQIFVGYGIVDPKGEDCKIFPPHITGQDNNLTVCLPWWRIERVYAKDNNITDEKTKKFISFLSTMQRPRPPKNISVCNTWEKSQDLPGGKVTCTTYYDKSLSEDCYKNPKQNKCFKNNCGSWVINNCKKHDDFQGYKKESLQTVQRDGTSDKRFKSRIDLKTQQFLCPGGSFTNYANCTDEDIVTMQPYECKEDNPSTPLDDSIMKYCDSSKPVRDVTSGNITGFSGKCPSDGNTSSYNMTCKINSFSQTRNTCEKYADDTKKLSSETVSESHDLNYIEQRVRVLSGEADRFADRDDCVRANTIEGSRDDSVYMLAEGSGAIDDDIYVIVHSNDDSHSVAYCNQQHNRYKSGKIIRSELGGTITCVQNTGNYTFSEKINIKTADIVSIQQATEDEDAGKGPFDLRTHYVSTAVKIDGIEAIPAVSSSSSPFYPKYIDLFGTFLNLWENTLGSLSLMFPYSGSYTIYFYNAGGNLVVTKKISHTDFNTLGATGYKQLFLAEKINLSSSLDSTKKETLCLHDDWTEYGGGIFGKKKSSSGEACQAPSPGSSYQKSAAITKVIVKDELTGSLTKIPLVYPLGYPNRVFVSKLKLYESRIYNCYDSPNIKAPY